MTKQHSEIIVVAVKPRCPVRDYRCFPLHLRIVVSFPLIIVTMPTPGTSGTDYVGQLLVSPFAVKLTWPRFRLQLRCTDSSRRSSGRNPTGLHHLTLVLPSQNPYCTILMRDPGLEVAVEQGPDMGRT